MFRQSERNPFDKNEFMKDDIQERKDFFGKMLDARKTKSHYDTIFSPRDNFFSTGPKRSATEGELYFDSNDNTIYRGNRDGSWTKATQLSEVVVTNLIGRIVKSDAIRVFGFGGDAVAGSGNLRNDRGSGSIPSPGHDLNTTFDLGYLLGKLFPNPSMMIPWLLEFELRLKYGTPNKQSSAPKNTNSTDPEMIIMSLYNYSATDVFGGNHSQVHEKKVKDTAVEPSQKGNIEQMNSRAYKKATQERDANNRELQKKLDYYKQ